VVKRADAGENRQAGVNGTGGVRDPEYLDGRASFEAVACS
jgi:hypothetical protein